MNDVIDNESQGLDPTIDFLAGVVSGMAGLVVGYPFDTVKVRFQSLPQVDYKYHSTVHAITTIIREEQFIGLYKGILSPLASVALINGLVFATYRFFLKIQLDNIDSIPTLSEIALAGVVSGIVASIITSPTELIKIRQQSLLVPTSVREVSSGIFRNSGVRGLYRGLVATAIRDSNYGAYFFAYEATCRYLVSPMNSTPVDGREYIIPSWLVFLIAGGIAGIVGWLATFPFDVVKTRIQTSEPILTPLMPSITSPSQVSASHSLTPLISHNKAVTYDANPYRTILSTIVNSYHEEGIQVFYRGLAPTLIRAIPVNMVTFATFEAVVKSLS